MSKVSKKCLICGKDFLVWNSQLDSKYCSRECYYKAPKPECTKETAKKISESHLGNKNPMWRGKKVGMEQLHTWVRRRMPKPKLCECCKKIPPYDLANKGIYNRELKNWEWLCRKCHMTKDGRIKRFNSKENREKGRITFLNNYSKPRKTREEKLAYWREYNRNRTKRNHNRR